MFAKEKEISLKHNIFTGDGQNHLLVILRMYASFHLEVFLTTGLVRKMLFFFFYIYIKNSWNLVRSLLYCSCSSFFKSKLKHKARQLLAKMYGTITLLF